MRSERERARARGKPPVTCPSSHFPPQLELALIRLFHSIDRACNRLINRINRAYSVELRSEYLLKTWVDNHDEKQRYDIFQSQVSCIPIFLCKLQMWVLPSLRATTRCRPARPPLIIIICLSLLSASSILMQACKLKGCMGECHFLIM